MPNAFDTDARGPGNGRLFVLGVCLVVIAATVAVLLVAKSKGQFDNLVRVTASLVNVGDGLPELSDVKFRGALVGFVSSVNPAQAGQPNTVHIALKPEFASSIPNVVTARVVPSNFFAVSTVQLVDHGPGPALHPGAVIPEDKTLPTLLFQTLLDKLRKVLSAVGRQPTADSIGVLTALGRATSGRGAELREAFGDLNDIVTQLNGVVGTGTDPTTLAALSTAVEGLRNAAPDLFDALGEAITPARTLAEKRVALSNLLSTGLGATHTLADTFDHQTDRLINITTQLSPVVGVLADNRAQLDPIFTRLQRFSDNIFQIWDPVGHRIRTKVILSLTPTRTYVRSDCPRYGELLGPSCQTAPEVPTAPELFPALGAMGYPPTPGLTENRPNLAPPRNSVLPPAEPAPLPDPPPSPPANPAVPESPLPAEAPPPSGGASSEPPSSGTVHTQSAEIGGVGSVGGPDEKTQLSRIVGGEANAATVLMLGPLVRGATVTLASDTGGSR